MSVRSHYNAQWAEQLRAFNSVNSEVILVFVIASGLCACAILCPLPLCLPSTVRLAPLSGRHVAVPRALLAAPVASTSTATSTATRYLGRRRAVLIKPDPPPIMEALLP